MVLKITLNPLCAKGKIVLIVLCLRRPFLLQIPSAYSQINMMQKSDLSPINNGIFNMDFTFIQKTSPYGRYDRNNRYKNGKLLICRMVLYLKAG